MSFYIFHQISVQQWLGPPLFSTSMLSLELRVLGLLYATAEQINDNKNSGFRNFKRINLPFCRILEQLKAFVNFVSPSYKVGSITQCYR